MCRGDWKFSGTLHYLNKYEDNVKIIYISQRLHSMPFKNMPKATVNFCTQVQDKRLIFTTFITDVKHLFRFVFAVPNR